MPTNMTAPFSARWHRVSACLLVLAGWIGPAASVRAFDYAEWRLKEVTGCEAIDPSESQSGLMFNPDGYRSYYVRSKCLQEAAVRFRDAALCDQVRQRRSLFGSSWGYSAARCRQLVAEGVAADRRALEEMKRAYAAGGMSLRDFRIVRNGNGRDIDIIPSFAGTYAQSYQLTFEILQPGSAPALLHSSGYYVDPKSNLHLYVPSADIRRRFPAFSLDRVYTVRGTATLSLGFGGQSGYWSPAFIEEVFPVRARSRAITRQTAF